MVPELLLDAQLLVEDEEVVTSPPVGSGGSFSPLLFFGLVPTTPTTTPTMIRRSKVIPTATVIFHGFPQTFVSLDHHRDVQPERGQDVIQHDGMLHR